VELNADEVRRVVGAALAEDLGERGDLTTDALLDAGVRATGRLVARSGLVLAGVPVVREVYAALDASLHVESAHAEGARLRAGDEIVRVEGDARPILRGERTALNFLMRLCGIATAARAAVDEVSGTHARVLDTRKTAPGLRHLDKYAVACGGALNHRMGLHDAVLIKDTHLAACGSIGAAVGRARSHGHLPERVTVEVRSLEQLREALLAGAGRALLDNMATEQVRRAVELASGRIVLEASGGLRPGRLRAMAETGVDFLSVGWLTHSAPAADVAMELELAE
jgi:nicotinate-nucleotide pyrophosphorylase (carboxylating)